MARKSPRASPAGFAPAYAGAGMGTRWKALQLLRLLPALAAALLLAPRTFALSPDLQIRQLYHTAWTAAEGAPTGVEFLAQTSDGYLWIAAAAGLFRFDGIRFERIDSIRGRRLPSSNVMTLHAPRTGGSVDRLSLRRCDLHQGQRGHELRGAGRSGRRQRHAIRAGSMPASSGRAPPAGSSASTASTGTTRARPTTFLRST